MGFYAASRLELNRTENVNRTATTIDHKTGKAIKSKVICGHRVLMRVDKDKTGSAHQGAESTFVYSYDLGGIDPVEDLIYVGASLGWVHNNSSGMWWLDGYEDEKQKGRLRFKRWLRRNVAVADELEQECRDAIAGMVGETAWEDSESAEPGAGDEEGEGD